MIFDFGVKKMLSNILSPLVSAISELQGIFFRN